MRRRQVIVLCLAATLGTAACQEQQTDPSAPSDEIGAALMQSKLPGWGLQRGSLKLPASGQLTDQYLADEVRRAIDPGNYVCSSTPLRDWLRNELDTWSNQEPEVFDLLYNRLLADLIPSIDAVFFQTDDTPQFFGYNGEYTAIMLKTEQDAKRFWDIFSDDIQLIGTHGTMLLDVDRVAAAYEFAFTEEDGSPLTPERARALAILVRDGMLRSETLNGGNHPVLSFGAFAIDAFGETFPAKIVMGDGTLVGYEAIGFGDVAPQAIYNHEFAHHIQFEYDYFSDPVPGATTVAELTRYTELMADAMSAYFLTHKRGAAMNRKRVEQFLQVFFQVGDCRFTESSHHGTPSQRMAAAQFGFDLADEAQKQGQILTSEQFHDFFVAAYQNLVAPDVL